MIVELPEVAATDELAERIAAALPSRPAGWTLLLEGELGAGKSTLARALIGSTGHSGPVPSPTYTLVEPYDTGRGMIYHIDLYRVSSPDELHFLGWTELDDGLRLVEWPDRAPELAAQADIRVRLAYRDSGRLAELEGLSGRGRSVVQQLATVYDPQR